MTFPTKEWQISPPEELGFDAQKLADVETYLRNAAGDTKFQVGIVRNGYLVAEGKLPSPALSKP